MATIKDIADRVGISKAAVSRILNGKGSFSQQTIYKVEKAARELNYTLPQIGEENQAAHNIIAVVVPLEHLPYFSVFAACLEKKAWDYEYSVLLCSSAYDQMSNSEFVSWLNKKRISGLILATYPSHPQVFEECGIPVITAGFKLSEQIPSVTSDNLACGTIAARHFMSKNCKDFLYISAQKNGLKEDPRYQGFYEELDKHGKIVWPYIISSENESSRAIAETITEMIVDHPEADAVFAESQTLSLEVIRILQDLGYNIPEQIHVIGCGSPYFSNYSIPRMTMVKENTNMIAKKSVSLLVDLIEKGECKKKHLQIPVSLEISQTT